MRFSDTEHLNNKSQVRESSALSESVFPILPEISSIRDSDIPQNKLSGLQRFQKVCLFYNPISSSGLSEEITRHVKSYFFSNGIECSSFESSAKASIYRSEELTKQFNSSDLLIAISGDGTLRKLLPFAAKHNLPVYMIPTGKESLFAGLYGMSRNLDNLSEALSNGKILERHFGNITASNINGPKPFYLMCSMGFDSLTIQNIGERQGRLNNFKYTIAGLNALTRLHYPKLTVVVDDIEICNKERGSLIIANTHAYARGLCLLPTAHSASPQLVVSFDPLAGLNTEIYNIAKMATKSPSNLARNFWSGKVISVTVHENEYPLQVDGDYFRNRPVVPEQTLAFSIAHSKVKILALGDFE